MRIGVVAGEASGDLLGSRVLAALKSRYKHICVEGIGGPLMQAQGLNSLYPMERLSVMGLVEPLQRLPELLRIRRSLIAHFRSSPPDLFLGIDAPDFNLALERKLRHSRIRTAHLVSPSVWAWRRGRIHKIKRSVDLMLCLFPFETAMYREHGVPADFVGHPLADEIPQRVEPDAARDALGLNPPGRLLAVLPGSRRGEVQLLAPPFLQAASLLSEADPQLSFVIPAANDTIRVDLMQILASYPELPLTLVAGRSRQVMAAADAVLLASGTAALEAALLKRPMVVAYRMGAVNWWLISRLVKIPYAALPNILADRQLVPELLQRAVTPQALVSALEPLLAGEGAAGEQLQAFAAIHRQLQLGSAERTAAALVKLLNSSHGGARGRSV